MVPKLLCGRRRHPRAFRSPNSVHTQPGSGKTHPWPDRGASGRWQPLLSLVAVSRSAWLHARARSRGETGSRTEVAARGAHVARVAASAGGCSAPPWPRPGHLPPSDGRAPRAPAPAAAASRHAPHLLLGKFSSRGPRPGAGSWGKTGHPGRQPSGQHGKGKGEGEGEEGAGSPATPACPRWPLQGTPALTLRPGLATLSPDDTIVITWSS